MEYSLYSLTSLLLEVPGYRAVARRERGKYLQSNMYEYMYIRIYNREFCRCLTAQPDYTNYFKFSFNQF